MKLDGSRGDSQVTGIAAPHQTVSMAATMVTLRLLQGGHEEMSALQRVLEAAPVYAERVTGAPPGQADAQSMYSALPPGKCYDDKFVLGIYAGDMMIGCADLIRGCPDSNAALIGLLLLAEPWQRRGNSVLGETRFRANGRGQELPIRQHPVGDCRHVESIEFGINARSSGRADSWHLHQARRDAKR